MRRCSHKTPQPYHVDVDETIEALGFFHIPNVIHIPEEEEASIRKVRTRPIFNNSGSNDRKRHQGAISETRIPLLMAQVRAIMSKLYPNLVATDPVLLRSRPGCSVQKAHADYIPHTLSCLSGRDVPRGALIALENGTSWEVWPGSHRRITSPIEKRQLLLSRGDIVFFRGDVINAGSAYKEANVRVHIYLDHPLVARDTNRTWVVRRHASPELQANILE